MAKLELRGRPHEPDFVFRLGGVDMGDKATSVEIRAAVGEVLSARVEMRPLERLDISVDASVVLEVYPPDGFMLIEEPIEGGGRRIRMVPEESLA